MRFNKKTGLGTAIFAALVCVLVILIVEDAKYTPPNIKFDEPPVLSENAADLNSATFDELIQIDGVGESTAEKIIDFRQRERPFETVQDLMLMKGFSVKKLEKILGKVYVK